MKIGVMFGSPETTTGGNALKFYSSVRMDIRRIGAIKNADGVIGNRTRVKVGKNKMAPPFREVEFDILYGKGISKEGELVDLGVAANMVEKSGAWFSYGSERIGQGRENAKVFLAEHPDMYSELENKILNHHGVQRSDAPPAPDDDKADAKTDAKADAKASAKVSAKAPAASSKRAQA